MIEIKGKYLCDGCIKEFDRANGCSCGFLENPTDSLKSGTILNGRFVVGKQIRESRTVKEYLCHDSQKYESLNSLVSDVNKLSKKFGLKEIKTENHYPETTKGRSGGRL